MGIPLPDAMISLDCETAKMLGFTSDRFTPISYLWGRGNQVIVSFIESIEQGRGYFTDLVRQVESLGYQVLVPTPLPQMETILRQWGWIPKGIYSEDLGDTVEVWQRAEKGETINEKDQD